MKRRVRKIANFFAFNLLFFALYLNFIHKDKVVSTTAIQNNQHTTAAFSGTVLVDNPVKKEESKVTNTPEQTASEKATEENSTALKLSIN